MPPGLGSGLAELVIECWNADPAQRFVQILQVSSTRLNELLHC